MGCLKLHTDYRSDLRVIHRKKAQKGQKITLDYYPFGLRHKGYNNVVNGRDHNWDYLGQERQEEFGLNWMNFRHRNYDPEIGRFFGVDPISEEFMSISTYQVAHNNPVWKIEIEGLEGEISPAIPGAVDVVNQEPENPKVIKRAVWGARSPIIGPGRSYDKIEGSLSDYYNTIVIHHSGNSSSYPSMNDVQDEHMDGSAEKADIGYHFGIDKDGNIYEGRPIDVKGAHVNKANTGKIGIVLLGDFDTKDSGLGILASIVEMFDDELTPEMQKALGDLVSNLISEYNIDYVGTHKEVNCERNCAGDKGQEAADKVKKDNQCSGPDCETGQK